MLGLTFVALATLTDTVYAQLASTIARRLRAKHLSKVAGTAYIGLAGALAT